MKVRVAISYRLKKARDDVVQGNADIGIFSNPAGTLDVYVGDNNTFARIARRAGSESMGIPGWRVTGLSTDRFLSNMRKNGHDVEVD